MFKPGYILDTDEKFGSAQANNLNVCVYQQGQLISYGGPIQEYDDIAVKINGSYFMRRNCEFKVR